MWQQEKKDSAIVSLALLLSFATTPMAVPLFVPTPVLAQSATDADSFPLPETVEDGTTVRIDGSMSLAAINQSLKQRFEQEFSGTSVEVAANGTNEAISALLDERVDLVAIARGLTPEEQTQGLAQEQFYQENIAIIVSTDNPFQGSLTDQQFADIFRGNITNWSELGGNEGTIRFIDRPETSDTRNAFRTYASFKGAEFTTGANATQIADDNTAEIVKQLGNDGISYAMAHHVSQLPNVRVVPLNETLPDNPNYPYSQPLVYAYRENPSANVASFLGFILSPQQQAIEAARATAASAIAGGGALPIIAQGAAQTPASPTQDAGTLDQQQPPESSSNEIPLWWLLLPTAVIVALVLWLFRSRLWPSKAKNNTSDGDSPDIWENEVATNNPNIAPAVGEPLDEMSFEDDAIGSVWDEQVGNQEESLTTNDDSNYPEVESFDEEPSPWDIEAPASVVNTPYPQLPDISQASWEESQFSDVVSDGENLDVKDSSDEIAEQPQLEPDLITDVISNETRDLAGDMTTEASVGSQVATTDDTTDDSNYDEVISPSSEQISDEVTNSHPLLPDITEDILNVVADAAEPVNDETVADLPEESDIFADSATFVGTVIGASAGNQCEPDFEEEVLNDTPEMPLLNLDGERNIVLKPRNAEWVYATWYIDETCQQALANQGISQLRLRLYDVTDLDLSYQTAEFVQEYELDSEIELYLAIPECDRDYLAEIGYVSSGDRWITISRSERVRVFATPLEDTTADPELHLDGEQSIVLKPRNTEWVYATWYIGETCQQALANKGISQLRLRLYDVTNLDLSYQTAEFVQEYELDSEIELYLAIPECDRDYLAEIGYVSSGNRWITISRSERVRVFATPLEDTTADPELHLDGEQSIVLKPRNDQWVYATWDIGETCQQALANQGISQLRLRLYDVTNLDLSYQTAEFVQEYELDSEIELYLAIPQSDCDYLAEIGYVSLGDRWITITRSPRVHVFATPRQDTIEDPVLNLDGEQTIVLQTRNAEWAYASWNIGEMCQQTLSNNGISQLGLRLYDVTNLDLSYQTPEFVQHYEIESGREEKYIAIPQSDRDYLAEIGYLMTGDRWITIARSPRIRVFGIPLTDNTDENLATEDATLVDLPNTNSESSLLLKCRTPKWAYASWYISPTHTQILQNNNISQLMLRLYDVTDLDLSYQTPNLVQQYECDEITSDRYVAIPATNHDYIAEIGYLAKGDRWECIVRSETIRVFSRPQVDFWFVADVELIIHGSTEAGATVNIAGKPIKLKSDGTFHLRIPFSDDSINYVMTAIAANGKDTATITKNFSQENSEG
ncbi:DUF4912 domain-containing protein [Nodularia sp. LEGE 06071]|uniref:DUF4912 domain-containing protein n=1 Tax=Nodularia sp. LEGE 06071 TaxID=2777965 RepID=UPI001D155763|nr:DUF4912 domain-containing protein [Nodularia sp. LEGE 06071]